MVGRLGGALATAPRANERAVIGRIWQGYGLEEHASVASFARFVLQIMQLGAPPHLLEAAIQAMQDEVRHAQLCFTIANTYVATPSEPGPFRESICEAVPHDPIAILESTIRDACIAETLAVEYAREALRQSQVAAISQVLTEIVADESRHSVLAWDFVAWLVSRRPELRDCARQCFEDLFHSIEAADAREAGGDPAHDAIPTGFGAISRLEELVIRRRAIANLLKPRAAALLAGGPAVETRPMALKTG